MNTKTIELPEQPVTCDDKETIIRNLLLERYQLQQEVSVLRDELARLNKALATRPYSPCTTVYYSDLTEQRVRELEAEVDDLKNLLETEIEENEMFRKELKELKGMV